MPKKLYKAADGEYRWMDERERQADLNQQYKTRADRRENGLPRQAAPEHKSRQDRFNARRAEYQQKKQKFLSDIPLVGGALAAADRGSDYIGDLASRLTSGATFNQDQRLGAAVYGAARAAQGDNFKDAYQGGRANAAEEYQNTRERTGLAGDVTEFAGSMLTPAGGGGKVVKAINAGRAAKGAKALGTLGAHAIGGAVTGGLAGAVEGAARAPDWTDVGNVASQAIQTGAGGALGGAVLGPLMGLAGTGANKLAKSIRPRTRASALGDARFERALAEGDILDETMAAGHTPARMEQRIADLESQGAEPRLADITEFGQRRLKALVDKGTEGVEQARKILSSRATRRAGRLRQEMGKVAGVDPFYMSKLDQASHKAARGAQAETDYKIGGIMEGAVKLPPAAQRIIQKDVIPNSKTEQVFKDIYNQALENLSADPKLNGLLMKGNKPTRRVINEMIKIFRAKADREFTSGDATIGNALSTQMKAFRQQVMDHNPRMRQMIEKQAKEFAWERASKEGEKLAVSVDKEPELVLARLRELAADPKNADEYEALRAAILGKVMSKVGSDRRSSYAQSLLQRMSDDTQPNHMELWNELLKGGGQNMRTRLSREGMPIATDQRLMGSPTGANMAGMSELDDAVGAAGNAGRALAGGATQQYGMMASGMLGMLTAPARRKLAEIAAKKQRRQLQALIGRVRPDTGLKFKSGEAVGSSLTRMQKRAAAARATRDAMRKGQYQAGGRLAGFTAGKLTEQDQ